VIIWLYYSQSPGHQLTVTVTQNYETIIHILQLSVKMINYYFSKKIWSV